ncbi:MAG TPA: glycine cleavage T C-terminal barrel domain-containing protein [Gemmatimonadaceae bacterium]|nr:glycine cleavage T C-terminal barrel domain-containing protein [Gemmatimonadaceae bacterium]
MPDETLAGAPPAGAREAVEREYAALRSAAILVDRSARARATFSGPKSAEVLTGLFTNDVLALTPGDGQYAAALTAKGKVLADLRIFATGDGFLVDLPPRAAPGWWTMIRKYVNPRLSKYADVSETLRDVGVFGVGARALAAQAIGMSADILGALAPYAHRPIPSAGEGALVARVPDLGLEGFELLAPPDAAAALWQALRAAGATPAGHDTFDVARIEAGRPEWGLDIDDTTLAQEANLHELGAISYTKGCYTGQETVARVHFRGHVNRHLRGIQFPGSDLPSMGSALRDAEGRVVGEVRSTAWSPRLGGIALAMIRREVEPGGIITAAWDDAHTSAVVIGLPFPL